jgi:anti-sigma factor RsiW
MSEENLDHPSEERLLTHALNGGEDALVAAHLKVCTRCAEQVEGLRVVREKIESIPDEDVPERVTRRILDVSRRRARASWRSFLLANALPFLIVFGLIIVSLFLYYLYSVL